MYYQHQHRRAQKYPIMSGLATDSEPIEPARQQARYGSRFRNSASGAGWNPGWHPARRLGTAAARVRIQPGPINNRPQVDNPPHFYAHTAAQVIESHKLHNFEPTPVDTSQPPPPVPTD